MNSQERRIRPTGRTFCRGERIRTIDEERVTKNRGEFDTLADPDDVLVVPCPAAMADERRLDAAFVLFDGVGVPYERLFSE